MGRELFIFRHGKAEKNTVPKGRGGDFGRDLKDKGKRNAQRTGAWLAEHDLLPDTVVSSPAIRALTTAQKCCKSAGLNGVIVKSDARLYQAKVADVMDVLRETPNTTERMMVVGHNPSMENILTLLSAKPVLRNEKNKYLLPGTLARLRIDCDWKDLDADCAEVVEIVEPKTLPRLFPFPCPGGTERRSRPAYYYRQSSVVPFRRRKGELEVLIISSSGKKHWVIPKGIHDPGLSAQESAAKEAFEEAGVKGRVLDVSLGAYSYAKWGATCEVTVYPMEVTKEISDAAWEERHRTRKWVPVEKAASLVLNDDVKRIITALSGALGEAA